MGELLRSDLIMLLSSIGFILIFARIGAELGKKIKMPGVIAEILLGIVIGPTILGTVFPEWGKWFFPSGGDARVALDGIVSISAILLLFVAGMEVQMSVVLRQGKAALTTGTLSMLFPFIIGFATVWYFPHWFHDGAGQDMFLFALFMGTALAISALPVIARMLMDLGIFRTDTGMLIVASAMFNDLVGWLFFSFILSMLGNGHEGLGFTTSILSITGFGLFMFFIGRRLINRSLPWIQTKLSWPGGVLSIALGVCFLSAAFTEGIHIHAILGAFIAGIAFGDSPHLHERAREIIHQFVTNFFAPLFFVSIGLRVNFFEHFDWFLVVIILVLASLSKIFGAGLGAFIGGLSKRRSLGVGFALNARGAMEIILATLALNAKLIDEKIFVALVVMALATSLVSGPLMKKFLD